MRAVIIQQSPQFVLTSYGNGTAYKLENTGEALSVFVQGDDAATFRDELDKFESCNPEGDALAYLWDCYSLAAQPE